MMNLPEERGIAREITRKQKRFVAEYIKDLNGTQAAIRAAYSPKTANEQSSQLLTKLHIQAAIDEALRDRELRTQITADNVLIGLYKTACYDIAEAYNEDGTLKNIHDIPKEVRHAIVGIEVFEEFVGRGEDRIKIGETKKVKFGDRTRAQELLAKHLKLLIDRIEIRVVNSWDDLSDEEQAKFIEDLGIKSGKLLVGPE